MQRHIPNALTLARLVMTAAFVALLSLYNARTNPSTVILITSLVVFVTAALSDALDGYLARKWQVVSVFGRIMDPTADKLLVLGAFVMLASPSFAKGDGVQLSGVASWMVVVIIARELLITVLRAVIEKEGVSFAAAWTGKWKMIAQSVAVPLILLLLILADQGTFSTASITNANSIIAWVVVVITALSGIDYAIRGSRALAESKPIA
jgi:CDP-diacylglycerol---glycerol-3-phosphate 3-phosphatidyltransferase